MSVPGWVVPAAALTGSSIVAVAGFFVQRWRYNIDRLSAAVDLLCSEINSAADLATACWLLDKTEPLDAIKASQQEPQIVGRQLRIQALLLALTKHDKSWALDEVNTAIADLYDAMTGDNFRGMKRPANIERVQSVQSVAADLNGKLRMALSRRNKRWKFW
jgi:hypothetical protein